MKSQLRWSNFNFFCNLFQSNDENIVSMRYNKIKKWTWTKKSNRINYSHKNFKNNFILKRFITNIHKIYMLFIKIILERIIFIYILKVKKLK